MPFIRYLNAFSSLNMHLCKDLGTGNLPIANQLTEELLNVWVPDTFKFLVYMLLSIMDIQTMLVCRNFSPGLSDLPRELFVASC